MPVSYGQAFFYIHMSGHFNLIAKRFIVHCGDCKTGSTSIQAILHIELGKVLLMHFHIQQN